MGAAATLRWTPPPAGKVARATEHAGNGRQLLSTEDEHDALEDVLDFESIARFFVTEELAKDVDGYAFSTYLELVESKFFHIAPWDLDLAFGYICSWLYSQNACTGDIQGAVEGWKVEELRDRMWSNTNAEGWPNTEIVDLGANKRQLFLNIWQHQGLRTAFIAAWKAARQPGGPLVDAVLAGMVANRSNEIEHSARRDLNIWRKAQRCAIFKCCHQGDTADLAASTGHLSEFLLRRAHWIDEHVD